MRRSLAFITASAVTLSLMPAAAFAADGDGTDMLVNGGFESELLGSDEWHFTKTGGWISEKNAEDKSADVTMEKKHSGECSVVLNDGTIGQRVTLEAGKRYVLTAYVTADAAESNAYIGFYDGSAEWPASSPVERIALNADTSWKEVTVTFDGAKSQDYVIIAESWNSGVNVYIDDVTLTETDITYESGYIVNGGFDDDTAWEITGEGTIADGKFSVSGENYETELSQIAVVPEDGVYELSAYVTSTDISGATFLYAKTEGSAAAKTAIPQTEAGTASGAMRITVPGIEIEGGSCTVGLYAEGSSDITLDNVSLLPSDDTETRVQFLKGGEISKLTYVEDMGGVFRDADGNERDALQIMAENGFNLARIRLLDDPGKGRGQDGYYLPEYYMTLDDCLDLARRAKSKGMQIMFTFAYSDYWVDAEKQMVPRRWQDEIDEKGYTGEELVSYLEDKVYEYTADVMEKLIAQGTTPEYVSIGNEIQAGMLFNDHKNNKDNGLYANAGALARFLAAGAKAVRETSPETKIAFHSDNGGDLYRRGTFISALRSVDTELYDIIGVSYYPYYSSSNTPQFSADTVVNDFKKVIDEFDKDVIIMETGYNWNEFKPDGPWEGQLKDSGYYQDIYGETENGQRAFLTELYAKLKQTAGGRCIGDLYWDPVMIDDDDDSYKVGWAIRESDDVTGENVVPNSTLFDFDGCAVEGQKAMLYNADQKDTLKITGKVSDGSTETADMPVTITVNGVGYETATDAYGEYIASVPYPDTETITIGLKGSDKVYEYDMADMPLSDIMIHDIDFDDVGGVTVTKDESGNIVCSVSYTVADRGAEVFAALYDENGVLVQCVKAEPETEDGNVLTAKATFAAAESIGKVKAFLWNDGVFPETRARAGRPVAGSLLGR